MTFNRLLPQNFDHFSRVNEGIRLKIFFTTKGGLGGKALWVSYTDNVPLWEVRIRDNKTDTVKKLIFNEINSLATTHNLISFYLRSVTNVLAEITGEANILAAFLPVSNGATVETPVTRGSMDADQISMTAERQ